MTRYTAQPSVLVEMQRRQRMAQKITNLVRFGVDCYALLCATIYTAIAICGAGITPASTFLAVFSLAALCGGLGFILGRDSRK